MFDAVRAMSGKKKLDEDGYDEQARSAKEKQQRGQHDQYSLFHDKEQKCRRKEKYCQIVEISHVLRQISLRCEEPVMGMREPRRKPGVENCADKKCN